MDTTPFYILLFIHLTGLVLGFGSVLVTDLFGLLWTLDHVRFQTLLRVGNKTEIFIWIGYAIMVAAGIPLAFLKGEIDNLMIIKLFFVVIIGFNGLPLYRLQRKLQNYKIGENVPNLTMFRLILSLTVSQIAWWSAVLIGFLHRHVQTIINWPDNPWLVCSIILSTILTIWAAGEIAFKVKNA